MDIFARAEEIAVERRYQRYDAYAASVRSRGESPMSVGEFMGGLTTREVDDVARELLGSRHLGPIRLSLIDMDDHCGPRKPSWAIEVEEETGHQVWTRIDPRAVGLSIGRDDRHDKWTAIKIAKAAVEELRSRGHAASLAPPPYGL